MSTSCTTAITDTLTKNPGHETISHVIEKETPSTGDKHVQVSEQPFRLDSTEARHAFLAGCVRIVARGDMLPAPVMIRVARGLGLLESPVGGATEEGAQLPEPPAAET